MKHIMKTAAELEVRSAQVEAVGKLLEEGATVPFIARYRKEATGMTATAGIGTNLYLCKIAMDIEAKHTAADGDGVRIAELDEMSYRQKLWTHRPLTDFWRIGKGYARKLEAGSWKRTGFTRWVILPAVLWAKKTSIIMRIFFINCSG